MDNDMKSEVKTTHPAKNDTTFIYYLIRELFHTLSDGWATCHAA